MNFLMGLTHQKVSVSLVVKSERGRVFSSSVEDFRVCPLEYIYRISFPHYLRLSTKSRFYKYFSAV